MTTTQATPNVEARRDKLVVWGVNRVVDWFDGGEVPLRWRDALRPWTEVTLGNRNPFDAPGLEASRPGALMHERQHHDEYFVPIPLKCIGDPNAPFWTPFHDHPIFAVIRSSTDPHNPAAYTNPCFCDPLSYWRETRAVRRETGQERGRANAVRHREAAGDKPRAFHNVRMKTTTGLGYYEILRRLYETGSGRHLVVGYSQGGMVARYLAFLDETFFAADPCIAGIVTVEAPLRGSPVANHTNHESVIGSLFTILFAVAQILRTPGIIDAVLRSLTGKVAIDIDNVTALIDDVLDSAEPVAGHPGGKTDKALDILRTTRKWISGLSGVHDLAFYDLDTSSLDQKGRVLGDTVHTPLRKISHGAVIGTNNRLVDFVANAADNNFWARTAAWAFREVLVKAVVEPQRIYTTVGLTESAVSRAQNKGPVFTQMLDDYGRLLTASTEPITGSGWRIPLAGEHVIAKNAHDFVIPSASQAFGFTDTPPRCFLGNFVNPDATHISGADRSDPPPTDEDHVLRILERISPRD